MSKNKAMYMLLNVWFPSKRPVEIVTVLRELADELERRINSRELKNPDGTDLQSGR